MTIEALRACEKAAATQENTWRTAVIKLFTEMNEEMIDLQRQIDKLEKENQELKSMAHPRGHQKATRYK